MIGFRETSLEQLAVDHRIEVNTLTGTARLLVPIRTSPGRESFGPALALGYGSGQSNSPYGVGWFLSGAPSIGLDTTQKLPTYRGDADSYVYGGQPLVPMLREQEGNWLPVFEDRGAYRVQRFRSTIERSFERFERWSERTTGRVHWLVYARNGVVSVFGLAADDSTRIADPEDPDQRTFQWLLEAQYHPKGNAIVYQYKPEDGAGVDGSLSFESRTVRSGVGFAQRYLKRILYGNSTPLSLARPSAAENEWHFEVVFDYGEHGTSSVPTYSETPHASSWLVRSDPFSVHRLGFALRTYRLCRRVLMFHRFPELDGGAPCLVGATELNHRTEPVGTVLESLTHRGYRKNADGSLSNRAVPALELEYSDFAVATAFEVADAADNIPSGVDGNVCLWLDIKNEGLPGILCRQAGSWYFKENLGDGRFGPTQVLDEAPAALSAAFQLQDFDGDGNVNLVGFEGREAGYYRRDRQDGRWEGFRTFRDLPRVDFANARVQWVDLNGDGHPDLIVERSEQLVWYPSEGADGFAPAIELTRPDVRAGGAPTVTQDVGLRTFFADMTGDGLLDMVRLDSGRVEYWPNLGHGRFGLGVVMEAAPTIDTFGEVDPRRFRLVDLDGSGTADLLYIGRGEVRFWINQSGNRFGTEHRIGNLPYIDRLASTQVFDFLGDGTRCLVWSTPLPSHEGQAIQYLRLTADLPPGLLLGVSNGVGREARLAYQSSAREYLRDKQGARPWRCLLPRHSMVVHRLEGIDRVGGARLVTRYEYRDGYFDDEKRSFVGFGLVDAFDTDQLVAPGGDRPEEVTLPSLVRSWYHSGAAAGFRERARDFYARDALAERPPDPHVEDMAQLTTEEQLDAYRAISGLVWRQEFYGLRQDGSRQPHPFRTTELAYRIRRLQPAADESDAVFGLEQSEALSHEYEQDPSDPRVAHELLLESDAFGNVTTRASIAYPRRSVGAEVRAEQQELHALLTRRAHQNIDHPLRFETGIETEVRRYSLSGVSPVARRVFDRTELQTQIHSALADPLAFHDPPPASASAPRARLVAWRRNRFWDDARASAVGAGDVGAVTLLHHVERAVFPEGAVDALYEGRVDGSLLATDGRYRRDESYWWADDATFHYRDESAFFRLHEETLPAGGTQTLSFDQHWLLVTAIEDVFGNRVESAPDYQVLASSRILDANDNVSEVLYDALGVVFATTLHGRQLGSDGNSHRVGDDDIAAYVPVAGLTAADVLSDPSRLLQGATRFFFYDLEAFGRGEGPPRSVLLERERHRHDGEGSAPPDARIRTTVGYIDGLGRAIQTKVRADAGPAIQRSGGAVVVDDDGRPRPVDSVERWLTSGHDVYNNKGWVVRKYEPWFSTTPELEADQVLREYGVATRAHYDPIGRVVRQDLPNGTFTTSEYTSWATRQADANDNIAGSDYEAERRGLPATDVERRALDKALAHKNTPTIVESDSLGRPFRLRETGVEAAERVSTTVYGVLGLAEHIIDPRNLTVSTYRYDMLGRTLLEQSMDAGVRCTLLDAQGQLIHLWDARRVHSRYFYDQNGRHVETRVQGAVDFDGTVLDNVVERVSYGDGPEVPQAKLKNARGRPVRRLDDAGIFLIDRYHMAGQPIELRQSLRSSYKGTVDWTEPTTVGVAGAEHRSQTRLDAFGRVTSQLLPDGTTREYDYARLGHVCEVRLTTADAVLDRKVIASDMETNARGQRTRLVLGNDVETTYEYDRATFRLAHLYTRRVSGETARDYLDLRYTYDPVGNITHWIDRVQDPGAATPLLQGLTVSSACEFSYDPFYRLKEATGRVHRALLQPDYRSGLESENAIKGTRYLTLNDGAAIERYTRTYDYDLAGNIQRTRHRGVSQSWTTEIWTSATSNRSLLKKDLNGVDVALPETSFDANGNTVRLPHLRAMDWNYANRLARAVLIDRSDSGQPDDAEYYVYDASGLRVRRVTEKLVDGQLEVTETTYFAGCELRRLTHGGYTRLLRFTSHVSDGSARLATLHQWSLDRNALETDDIAEKKLHYLVGNHLGSVSLELDEEGGVISYEEYFPFGGTSFLAGKSARDVKLKDYRYSGKCRDDATGFYCYEYRYYAPFIGNWLSPDPLGVVDGLNLYQFVHNNPIRFVDPLGLFVPFYGLEDAPEPVQRAFFTNTEEARQTVIAYVLNNVHFEFGGVNFVPTEATAHAGRDADGEFVRWYVDMDVATLRPLPVAVVSDEEDFDIFDPAAPPQAEPSETESPGSAGGNDSSSDGEGTGTGTAGEGEGAGSSGDGEGGGGEGDTAGRGGAGSGLGTAPNSRGPGTGGPNPVVNNRQEAQAGTSPGEREQPGREGGTPRGQPGGRGEGGSGARQSSGSPDGTAAGMAGGTPGAPPVPSDAPTDAAGIPFSADQALPEVRPEAGTPSGSDPSHSRQGGDPRAEPGSETGSATRPGGTEGGRSDGNADYTNTGEVDPEGDGGPGGVLGILDLPRWLTGDSGGVTREGWDRLNTVIDILQVGLDAIGLIPGVGEVADGLNGLISLARGDEVGAALSFAAMIPFVGWGGTAARWGRRLFHAIDAVADISSAVARYGDEVVRLAGLAAHAADDVAQQIRALGRTSIGQAVDLATGAGVAVRYADLSSGAARLVQRLQDGGRTFVGSGVRVDDLRSASMFLNRELGVAIDSSGRLVAVAGSGADVVFRNSDTVVAHTHPVFTTVAGHLGFDIAQAGSRVETVIDWGGNITHFNRGGIIANPSLSPINALGYITSQLHRVF